MPTLTCPVCSKPMRTENGLKWHLENIHGQARSSSEGYLPTPTNDAPDRRLVPTISESGDLEIVEAPLCPDVIAQWLNVPRREADGRGRTFGVVRHSRRVEKSWMRRPLSPARHRCRNQRDTPTIDRVVEPK